MSFNSEAHLKIVTITDTIKAILVKADGEGYKSGSGKIRLHKINCRIVKSNSNDIWQINFGVVVSQDTTEGIVKWVHHLYDWAGNDTIMVGLKAKGWLDLAVESGDLKYTTTAHTQTDSEWKIGGSLISAATNPMTVSPKYTADIGDLVMEIQNISASGNLNKNSFLIFYDIRK